MLKSNYSIIDECLIVDLDIVDFNLHNFTYLFSTLAVESKQTKVILNLESIEVITSRDIENIEKIVSILKLNGIDTVVCGINPYSASVIFSFIDNINFYTALDIRGAFDTFSTK